MSKDVILVKSPLWEAIQTFASMNIGDGFSYLWRGLMSIPMSSLIYLICLLIGFKCLFSVLKRFGVMGSK